MKDEQTSIIEVSGLSYRYESEMVFGDVNFRINKGDFVAIIGANGSGKSTLMRVLLGELDLQEGSVRLFGKNASSFKQWPLIGYVPQNSIQQYNNFPATVMEVITANLYSKSKRFGRTGKAERKAALEALAEVEMQDYSKRMLGELSGGQLQRVMLARVLVSDPELLILDEPTTGVDAHNVDLLYKKLAYLNQKTGRTVIMVTHDLPRSADYVSRVLCLEEGSLVELDARQVEEEIKHRHTHPHVEAVL